MRLSHVEAEFLSSAGTDLEVITLPSANKRGVYETFSDCGYLAVATTGMGICSVADSPSRPRACSELQPDSEPCNYMRRGAGLTAR
jgi:hypothetical protein